MRTGLQIIKYGSVKEDRDYRLTSDRAGIVVSSSPWLDGVSS